MNRTMETTSKAVLVLMALALVMTSGVEVFPAGGDLVVPPAEAAWGWLKWIPIPHFKRAMINADGAILCEGHGISCIVWH